MAPEELEQQHIDFLRSVVTRRLARRPELVCTEISPTNDHYAVYIHKKHCNGGKQIEVSRDWVEGSMASGDEAKLPQQFELLLDLYFPETFTGAAGQGL